MSLSVLSSSRPPFFFFAGRIKKTVQNKYFSHEGDNYIKKERVKHMGQMYLKRKYGSLIERYLGDTDLYNSVEELKEAEKDPDENGRINWSVWDKKVKECREELNRIFKGRKPVEKHKQKEIWVYDLNGKFLGHFNSAKETVEKMNLGNVPITQVCWRRKPYYKLNMIFSYDQLTEDDISAMVRKPNTNDEMTSPDYSRTEPKEKWVYDLNGNFIGHFETSWDVARKFNIKRKTVNYYAWKKAPYFKVGLIIRNKPMDKPLDQ